MDSTAHNRPRTKPKGPHPHKALSAAFCRAAPPGRHCDGNALYLQVDPSGARRWVQRLVISGKSRALGLGSFTLVSLAEARELALANRKLARNGGDPLAARRRAAGIPTFEEAADRVIAIHCEAWKNGAGTEQLWRGTLRDYAYPHLADKGIDTVTTADVMAVLSPWWTRKHATARKVLQRIGAVMKWAIAQGYRKDNPAGEAVIAALPKRPAQIQHLPALPHAQVAGAIAAVQASPAWAATKLAFEYLVLTAARCGEVRLAAWGEIDLAARVWTLPAARMKAGREHRVPLCSRAVEILHAAKNLGGGSTTVASTGLVFPTPRGKPLHNAKLSGLVQQLGIPAVPHGFRSSFRDWASERTNHPREVIEAALAHMVSNRTEAAYARSDLFERRRQLMDDWMEYLANDRRHVVPFHR